MYGLKVATLLTCNQLVTTLRKTDYYTIPDTMGLWRHTTRPIHFCLCVDDFGIKNFKEDNIYQFFKAIAFKYKRSVDWTGSDYCRLHLT